MKICTFNSTTSFDQKTTLKIFNIICLLYYPSRNNPRSYILLSNIFIIGATGHIGGAILDLFVIGDLTSLDILTREASEADIVINAGPDIKQEVAISAIFAGLAHRSPKTHYIHTSGAALIWDSPDGSQAGTKIWDDLADIKQLKSFPSTKIHVTSDALVFAASPNTHVAIVSPTILYGLSPSTLHPTPISLPTVLDAISELNTGFTISTGANIQAYIHVLDNAQIYLLLVDDALQNPSGDPQKWGPESYYFAASEELSFKEYMTILVSRVSSPPYNFIQHANIKQLAIPQVVEVAGTLSSHLFGVNMRVRCTRARDVLGWAPKEKKVGEALDEVLNVYSKGKIDGSGMKDLNATIRL
ncbi:hypothetical protein OCU04_007763 [Sclerotinia nivalis]|uniref:NAD-dependent epimerase/dehydratase domain-containing protein n=1 Tax=Sclerotinia nivalis TaxID=352851 RepID=A0A9X0AMV9_9HELO|nr:hypothetical protein OCU04_007763 [Sclerotinia nivalis]